MGNCAYSCVLCCSGHGILQRGRVLKMGSMMCECHPPQRISYLSASSQAISTSIPLDNSASYRHVSLTHRVYVYVYRYIDTTH
jgi:hypothetical protein